METSDRSDRAAEAAADTHSRTDLAGLRKTIEETRGRVERSRALVDQIERQQGADLSAK